MKSADKATLPSWSIYLKPRKYGQGQHTPNNRGREMRETENMGYKDHKIHSGRSAGMEANDKNLTITNVHWIKNT